MKKVTLSILSAAALSVASMQAQTVIETFNYTNGALGNKANTGTGETGNWQLNPDNTGASTATIATRTWLSTGITNYTVSPTNKSLLMSAFGQDASIQLATPISFDANSTIYFSILFQRETTGGAGLLALQDSNGASASVQKARLVQGVGGGAVTATIGSTGTGNTFPGLGGTGLEDFLMIGRITTVATGNDTIELLGRRDGQSIHATTFASNTGIVSANAAVTGSADFLYFWNGSSTALPEFGELRIGSTYASVIPEPSSMALLGLGLGGLALLRRRRR